MTNDLIKKEKRAIMALQSFEPECGYELGYSGGKDSDVIKILATVANVKFEAVHNHTCLDAPETVRYIRAQKDVKISYADHSFWWYLTNKKMYPPTRLVRWCCNIFKESRGTGKPVILGVRKSESIHRKNNGGDIKIIQKPESTKKIASELGANFAVTPQNGVVLNFDNAPARRVVEQCYRTRKIMINPIAEWTNDDVWDYLHYYGCNSNPLYQCGFSRIGCIGCPMAGRYRYTEFRLYPKYKQMYINAFDKMIKKRIERGLDIVWLNGDECFAWWMEENPDQLKLY